MQTLADQEIWREAQPSVRASASFSTAGEVSCPGRLLAYLSLRSAVGAADTRSTPKASSQDWASRISAFEKHLGIERDDLLAIGVEAFRANDKKAPTML